ncbi:MAG: type 1 glutamine amidotransferase [Candidatus Dormibacteraeota bacterium]|nr:type 1 glutamine amidotransferase [Candidatus Dormibacteraeota bacterium]
MKVACLLANGFEDSEFRKPYDALREAGHDVVIVGMESGEKLDGYKGVEKGVTVDKSFPEVSPDEFDALLIPGGHSPDRIRAQQPAVDFVRAFFAAVKPVAAICHGPQLFLTADTFKDHRMTAWKTIQGDLRLAGADVVDQEVVVDRNLVTSRQPSDIPAFIRETLQLLQVPSRA